MDQFIAFETSRNSEHEWPKDFTNRNLMGDIRENSEEHQHKLDEFLSSKVIVS